jgi:PAS domain-containing protein
VSGRSFTCDAVAGAVINDRGTIVYWTDEAAQLTGFSAEDVCGHSVRELLPNLHGSPNARVEVNKFPVVISVGPPLAVGGMPYETVTFDLQPGSGSPSTPTA